MLDRVLSHVLSTVTETRYKHMGVGFLFNKGMTSWRKCLAHVAYVICKQTLLIVCRLTRNYGDFIHAVSRFYAKQSKIFKSQTNQSNTYIMEPSAYNLSGWGRHFLHNITRSECRLIFYYTYYVHWPWILFS